jgi:flagellar biosynthesis protein FliQ
MGTLAILGGVSDFGQVPCGISPAAVTGSTAVRPPAEIKLGRVFTVFTIVLYAVTGILTLWSIVETIRNRPAGKALLAAAALLLLLLIVQLVVSIATFGSAHDVDPLLYFGYVITAILVIALAGFWAFAELSRWGPGVLAAAGLTVIVMIERLDQIWQ